MSDKEKQSIDNSEEVKSDYQEVNDDQHDTPDDADIVGQLEQAQAELEKMKDAYLRAKAEEDNVRRRAENEVSKSRKYAIEGFAKELLTVRDSLKIASEQLLPEENGDALKSIQEGVGVTLKQIDAIFERFSLVEISPNFGDKLDPNEHQAMSQIDSDEVDSGCIIDVAQTGYKLHDRLLRAAMVIVTK